MCVVGELARTPASCPVLPLKFLGVNHSSLPQGGHNSTSAEELDTSPKSHLPDCGSQCNYPTLSSLKERKGKSVSHFVKTVNLFLRLHGKCIIPNSIRQAKYLVLRILVIFFLQSLVLHRIQVLVIQARSHSLGTITRTRCGRNLDH